MTQRIEVEVVGSNAGLDRTLNQSEGKLSRFAGIGAKIGAGAALGVAGAGLAVGKFVSDSVVSLARVEKINTQTATVIKSTGGAAGVSAGHVEGLANRLEKFTTSEAEATQEGANLLLTFTNVRNEAGRGNAIFDRTTTAMVDMSRAMGQDTKASAIQLGKALNDPVKGVGALSRVGVSFTAQQKNTIATLVESGRTMDAQKVILGELEKQFGGSARAYAQTTEGQIEGAKNSIGALGETVAAGLLPLVGRVAGGITRLIDRASAAWPSFSRKARSALAPLRPVLTGAVAVVRFLAGAVLRVVPVVIRFAASIGQRLAPVARQLVTTFKTQVLPTIIRMTPTIVKVIGAVARFAGGFIKLAATVLGKVLPPLIRFAGFMFSRVFPAAVKVVSGIVSVVGALVKFGIGIGKAVATVLRFAVQVGLKVAAVVRYFTGLPGRITGAIGDLGGLLVGAGKSIIQGLLDGIDSVVGKVQDKLQAVTNLIPDWKGPRDRDAVLLRGAGELIIGGLIVGFDRKTPAVRRTLQALSREISDFDATPTTGLLLGATRGPRPARTISTPRPGRGRDRAVLRVRLTADQLTRLQRGREIALDLAAYRAEGGRR